MGSRQQTVDVILEQAEGFRGLSARKMFGEYGLFHEGHMIALVCDDQLFVKPTPAGQAHAAGVTMERPYPGSKPHLLIPGDRWDEADWLAELMRLTARDLPPPKAKGAKARKSAG